jgi:hypothetical protein
MRLIVLDHGDSHVPTKQLNLQRYHSFPNPHDREDAREDEIRLLARGSHRHKHAQQETEYQRAPLRNVSSHINDH